MGSLRRDTGWADQSNGENEHASSSSSCSISIRDQSHSRLPSTDDMALSTVACIPVKFILSVRLMCYSLKIWRLV